MKRLKAFTLVELLVVVVIIGILATLVVVGLSGASNKAKDAKTKTAVDAVATALQIATADGTSDLTAIKAACGAGTAFADVSGTCKTTIESAVGTFSSAPVAGNGTAIKVKVPTVSTYIVSGKASTSTGCFWRSDSDNSGLATVAAAGSANCW